MSGSNSYLVLARKYRPQTFDDVAGQEPIATTLKNAITLKKIAHAYLFTGPRGVGKTSMARIFAKALNCVDGPTVTPCGKCPSCKEIEEFRSLDVIEVDGASNRGIDEVRALRENVRFAPAAGKYKIYIIDEVHQITNEGFNALLKTLEEPPAHVKFIFATTSAQKVPATILSRCQRFDFRRIPTERIVEVLKAVCAKEKIKTDDEALFMIAKAADGSLRDSQTILDQIAASAEGKITAADVVRSLGSLEEETIVRLSEALSRRDAKGAILELDAALKEGKEPVLFLEKLLEHVRNLLFLQVSPDLLSLVDATESYKKEALRQKDLFTREDLFYAFAVIQQALVNLRRFDSKRIGIEIALIKLCERSGLADLASAIERLKDLEKKTNLTPSPAKEMPRRTEAVPPVRKIPVQDKAKSEREETEELPSSDEEIAPAPAAFEKSLSFESIWAGFVQSVKTEKMSVGSYLAEGEPGRFGDGRAVIGFPQRLTFFKESLEVPDNRRLLEKHLARLAGQEVVIEFEIIKEVAAKRSEGAAAPNRDVAPEENPTIKSAMNMFGGRLLQ